MWTVVVNVHIFFIEQVVRNLEKSYPTISDLLENHHRYHIEWYPLIFDKNPGCRRFCHSLLRMRITNNSCKLIDNRVDWDYVYKNSLSVEVYIDFCILFFGKPHLIVVVTQSFNRWQMDVCGSLVFMAYEFC
jgi:hypothetical protein